MSATADVARMLTLVPWLLERPGASVAEVAAAFDVSAATIRRDLAHLDFCGLPGLRGGDLFEVTTFGDRVVVRMADELRRPLRPTPREALHLVLAADAVTEVLGDEVPALRSATAKIRASLGIPEDAADVVAAGGTAPPRELHAAIRERRQVRLVYARRDAAAPSTREVDPWALHLSGGAWYLHAHDHTVDAHRTFRLDRIVDVEILDVPTLHAPPDELAPPRYRPGPDDVEVVLEVAAGGRWLASALDAVDVQERPDGGARLVFTTDAPGFVARLVLMAGGAARVHAPTTLADDVAALARAARARYERPSGAGATPVAP